MRAAATPPPSDDIEPPRAPLSPLRVAIALITLTVALSGSVVGIRTAVDNSGSVAPPWFAPYVDTTLTPSYAFQDHEMSPSKDVVLAFVVADPAAGCTPSWGGAYSLDQASTALDLDRRISQVRARGADVIVSFGGRRGTELAAACTDVTRLTAAYAQVVSRYSVGTIDLDVEGAALDDTAAVQRRVQALAILQRQVRAAGKPLAIWLTVPVGPAGMNANAAGVVAGLLAGGVDLGGVNLMTMDFGSAGHGAGDLLGTAETALGAAHDQVAAAYAKAGLGLNSKHIWHKLGATVMIGQNDVAAERFSVADAQSLIGFATGRGMARLSAWSINRDVQCGTNFAQIGVLSNTCSGVAQRPLEFSEVFGQLSGDPQAVAGVVTTPDLLAAPTPGVQDDASTAPYPIWQPQGTYRAGYKVVWRGQVYAASWYSQNFAPDTAGQLSSQTPWQLLGPVLPGDRPLVIPTLAPGTYPVWSSTATYAQGTRVLLHGLPYQARYSTTGSAPVADQADPALSSWTPLYQVPGEPY